jgi:hypothetical protein
MTAIDLTKFMGALTVLLSTVFLPLYINRRKSKQKDASSAALTHASVAQMFKDERDRLQIRLDQIESSHETQMASMTTRHQQEIDSMRVAHTVAIKEVEDKWRAQHAEDEEQIRQFKREISDLYARLYRTERPPPLTGP